MGDISAKRAKKEEKKEEKLKKARTFNNPDKDNKNPRFLSNPNDRKDKHPRWQFSRCDREHPDWGWANIPAADWQEITRKLGNFETMTWGQIEGDGGNGSHLVNIADCPNRDTQARLKELILDDLDTLFSLRLSGPKRIYGILDGDALKLLWYDPAHSVWPTKK